MTTEEIEQLKRLLAMHRRALAHRLEQRAAFDAGRVPSDVALSIDDARAEIARLKRALRDQAVEVEDAPGDVERLSEKASTTQSPTGAQIANANIAGIVDARGADFSGARGVQITGAQVVNRTDRSKTDDDH
jgi:ActR/RegA family two-component response regulator